MAKNLLLLIILYSTMTWAQKSAQPVVDIYAKTMNETATEDPVRALKIADSLAKIAKTPELKAKSYLLTANIYMFQYKLGRSVKYGEMAREVLSKTDNYELQARTLGLLAENYGTLKLYEKAEKCLDEGLKTADKIKDPVKKALVQSRFCTALAQYKPEKALDYHFKALEYLSKIPTDSQNVGHHYQEIGSFYFTTKKYKLSKEYYLKAINILPKGTITMAFAQNGLGEVLLEEKNYSEAEKIFLKTLEFAEKSQNTGMKNLVAQCLADLYDETKQYQKASFYRKMNAKTNAKLAGGISYYVAKDNNKIEKEKNKYASWNNTKNIVIGIASLFLLSLIIVFIINKKKQQEEYKKFKSIIDHYKEKEEYVLETQIITSDRDEIEKEEEKIVEEMDSENKQTDIAINKETEAKILEQLEHFEKDEVYNNSYISLSFLATEFNTNIRYISYVVKKHKGVDFKSYINKLRINYIIHKLNTSPKYRKYKVGALAEECGFSSHSKFTTIFKSITGISPSTFISFIEQEEAKRAKK
ncbi:helix-turn-helix domain-containing protein [Chryseobacterium sp. MMS23-Vi53]|uniref:helix-turn-helix domain-containing protein n=1 Tax=Chryseobacterium sp. MMS23-Vi53 TaxID=3386644 RepID=UPI0039EAF6D6